MISPAPKPSVGRIVHIFDPRFSGGGQALAGVVTYVAPPGDFDMVNVTAFLPSGSILPFTGCPRRGAVDEAHKAAVWDWPERI